MKSIRFFAMGVISTVLIGSLAVSALAASGTISITVNPNISIKVNGETFKPKDSKGNDAMVFEYNGTTYAPLRALAEAYGLEVGWDAGAKVASVGGNLNRDMSNQSAEYEDLLGDEKLHTNVQIGAVTLILNGKTIDKDEFFSYGTVEMPYTVYCNGSRAVAAMQTLQSLNIHTSEGEMIQKIRDHKYEDMIPSLFRYNGVIYASPSTLAQAYEFTIKAIDQGQILEFTSN